MKVLFEDYSFNPSVKQITLVTSSSVSLEQLLVITNVTTNTIIYNFADPSAGGTISNNIITLDYNTTSMSSTDKLQIFLDNLSTPASDEMLLNIQEQTMMLSRMVKLLEPSSMQDVNGRQKVRVEVFDPSLIVQHAYQFLPSAALTSPSAGSIYQAESTFNLQSRIAYATLRQNLEFS